MKSKSFVASCVFAGFEGIGLLIFFGLLLFSLSTPFWRPVHRRWRWFYAAATIILLLGVGIGALIGWWDMRFLYVEQEFAFFAVIMAFPIVAFGTGYLGLPPMLWTAFKRRIRKRKTAAHS